MDQTATISRLRGTVLRDASQGHGLISIQGTQYQFTLEKHWRSDKPPAVGARVDAFIGSDGGLIQLTVVDEAQLVKEKATEIASHMAGQVKEGGTRLFSQAVSEFGMTTLVAILLLGLSWTVLNLFVVQIGRNTTAGFSLWDLLRISSGEGDVLGLLQGSQVGRGGAGFWGFIAIACLVLPLVPLAWKGRFANIGFFAPGTFMAFLAWKSYAGVSARMSAATELGGLVGGARAAAMAEKMALETMSQAFKAISPGIGLYLSVALALYLCWVGVKRSAKQ